jgi:hypothetical protein
MSGIYPFQESPRCHATSKRTKKPCMGAAVKGWTVCRFHGARGGAPKGKRHGMYRHGLFTQEAIAERRMIRDLLRDVNRIRHRQGLE